MKLSGFDALPKDKNRHLGGETLMMQQNSEGWQYTAARFCIFCRFDVPEGLLPI